MVPLPNRPALASAWEVEILCEHVARVTIGRMIAFAASTAAAAVSVAEVVAIAVTRRAWVVSVEHWRSPTCPVSRPTYQ
jgi:hypothetical protein